VISDVLTGVQLECREWVLDYTASTNRYIPRRPRPRPVPSAIIDDLKIDREMAGLSLVKTLLCAAGLANIVLGDQQPWLDVSLPYEERLQSFLAQLNTTQKLAMTQGDTEVSSPPDFHTNINVSMITSTTTARRKRHRRKPLHRPHQRQHHPRNPQHLHGRRSARRQQLSHKCNDFPSSSIGK
jgi:hypothetical protein